jgi:hypothetical protein
MSHPCRSPGLLPNHHVLLQFLLGLLPLLLLPQGDVRPRTCVPSGSTSEGCRKKKQTSCAHVLRANPPRHVLDLQNAYICLLPSLWKQSKCYWPDLNSRSCARCARSQRECVLADTKPKNQTLYVFQQSIVIRYLTDTLAQHNQGYYTQNSRPRGADSTTIRYDCWPGGKGVFRPPFNS